MIENSILDFMAKWIKRIMWSIICGGAAAVAGIVFYAVRTYYAN
jgi:hypothetical protein